uniref:PH domain-containing protein n=1 Tax=Parascaris univalens TaxID=6257 RepID=A0A915C5X1_PARUN
MRWEDRTRVSCVLPSSRALAEIELTRLVVKAYSHLVNCEVISARKVHYLCTNARGTISRTH